MKIQHDQLLFIIQNIKFQVILELGYIANSSNEGGLAMSNKILSAKYRRYEIKQTTLLDKYVHHFYKDGKKMSCVGFNDCIVRSTKKQLYRYLRYLVNTSIIDKFDQCVYPGPIRCDPTSFDETNNKIRYS